MLQDRLHLMPGHNNWQPGQLSRTLYGSDLRQIDLQYFTIKKEDGMQGLILSRRRYISLHNEVGKKGAYFAAAHFNRMLLPVKQQESFNPIGVTMFCSAAHAAKAENNAYLFEKTAVDLVLFHRQTPLKCDCYRVVIGWPI